MHIASPFVALNCVYFLKIIMILLHAGNAINGTTAMKCAQPSTGLAQKSNSMPNFFNVNKRKTMKSSPNHPSEPKKSRTNSPNFLSAVGGIRSFLIRSKFPSQFAQFT